MIRSSKQRTLPDVALATGKGRRAGARESGLKLISIHTVAKETLNHTGGFVTQPIGMEVERDPSVLPDRFNYVAVRLQSIASAFQNAGYG
jgi:hypothetical protein